MKFKILSTVLIIIGVGISLAQTVSQPTGTTIWSTATLTNIYVASSSVDLNSYNTISWAASVPTAQANALGKLRPQWSQDNSTWFDDSITFTNAVVNDFPGVAQQYDSQSRVINLQMTNANLGYVEILPRKARYFRVEAKSTNVFTTATLKITAQSINNNVK